MSSAPQIALAREKARRKLHERIENWERDKQNIEFHRMTPYKVPTVIAAAGSGMTCAGRNSLNRYLRATGFSGVEVEISKETAVMFSAFETEPLISNSIVKLPVKVPGREKLVFLEVPILDETDRLRDFPIKLSEYLLPHDADCTLYPTVLVKNSGKAYDLFPFPAEGDCYDEGQTVVHSKEEEWEETMLSKDELEQELAKGIVCVVFIKLNGEERSLRGTTNEGFIPKQLQGKSNAATDESIVGANLAQLARSEKERGGKKIGEDQVVMFDVDIQSWRSCKYSNIIQLRVRLHSYQTWPGSLANLEEYFNQCKLIYDSDEDI